MTAHSSNVPSSSDQQASIEAPVVRIVSGSPTDAELAAVHAVIVAALADQASSGVPLLEPVVDGWRQSGRQMRVPLAPGPGAWSSSRGLRIS